MWRFGYMEDGHGFHIFEVGFIGLTSFHCNGMGR